MQKKIEGHTVFLTEKLGEGSFGKVSALGCRFIRVNTMIVEGWLQSS